MIRTLHLAIIAGPLTCYDFTAERMCEHVATTAMGTRWHCRLFSELGADGPVVLRESGGCLRRHAKCIEAEKGAER